MIVTADMVMGVLNLLPSQFFYQIPERLRKNNELRKVALERAASVAYRKQFEEHYAFVGALTSGLPGWDDRSLQEAATSLDVTEENLNNWTAIVEGWDRSEWFFVLFLAHCLEAGLFPHSGEKQ